MRYLIVVLKSLFFYILITIGYRLMGKREMGELSIMDFIVSIFLAELAAISIENYNDSMFLSILPIISLIIIQIITSKLSLNNSKLRDTLEGKPSVIINRGKVNFKEMLKQRYNLDDLLSQLRDKGIKSIEEVDYAILEVTGKLSIFTKEEDLYHTYPLPIIMDGKVDEDSLYQIHKSRKWLDQELVNNNYELDEVFYAFYKDNDLFIIKNNYIK